MGMGMGMRSPALGMGISSGKIESIGEVEEGQLDSSLASTPGQGQGQEHAQGLGQGLMATRPQMTETESSAPLLTHAGQARLNREYSRHFCFFVLLRRMCTCKQGAYKQFLHPRFVPHSLLPLHPLLDPPRRTERTWTYST